LTNKEIIVTSNGCDEKTLSYLSSLQKQIVWKHLGSEKVGYPKAVNAGVEIAQGDFIVLLDDDSFLLPQNKDRWIDVLYAPFLNDSKLGLSGPMGTQYDGIEGMVIHSGCAMYRKNVWNSISGFDEQFGVGYLSDTDISIRIQRAGYKVQVVCPDRSFPLYHADSPATTETKQKDADILFKNRNILYERHSVKPKISIVIPTYNHLDDCLKPCIESIIQYTDLSAVEVLIVANGCKDNTAEFVNKLGHPFKLIWVDEGIGYTKATNLGIKAAVGDYVVLLNNDTICLAQAKNQWLDMLVEPFEIADKKVGITGPLSLYDNYAGDNVMIFFCVCIKRNVLEELSFYEEI
jgi:GT2 family glycosyltransferase